jgi:DNA replication protein DnaC
MSTTNKKQASGPRLEVDGTREKLLQLGLVHAAEALGEELSETVKHNRNAHQLLERLLSRELRQREERRIRTSLRLSNLPPGMTLSNFDFGFQPSIDRRQIETLATCAFIREHVSLLLQGPPGVGKTHVGVGLGVAAIEHGFSVAFYLLEELLHEMRKDADVAPQRLRRKKYFNVAYLVVDEVGFEPMSHQDASLFFRLVSYRYMRGSTAITTNKSVKDWPGIFAGDEALTAAILDRLLHKSVVINIRGRSYRLQDLERLLK